MMVVIANPEPFADVAADHRTSPHAAREPRFLWSIFDNCCQLAALLLRQSRRRSRCFARPQSIRAGPLEPLKPAIDGPASYAELLAQFDNGFASQVRGHSLCAAPRIQVSGCVRLCEEVRQPLQLRRSRAAGADCLTILRASQVDLPTKRDRGTLILARSSVNHLSPPRMDPIQGDPVLFLRRLRKRNTWPVSGSFASNLRRPRTPADYTPIRT